MIFTGTGVLIVGVLTWRIASGSSNVSYQTATVTKGTIISSVSETGNIATASQGGVGSPTTGIITDIYVKDGDSVTQGQNLFKVKSTATAQEIASAYASYENAVVALSTAAQNKINAQATLEKDRAAVITASSGVITMQNNINISYPNPATKLPYSQNDIDSINSALTSARETFSADELKYKQIDQIINSANASENSAALAYQATQDSIVTAPVSGTVANITVRPGDQVNATSGSLTSNLSSSTTTSTSTNAVLSIGNFSTPYIKVQASEVDRPNIRAGEKATVTLSAFTGKTFVGTVYQVDSVGTISSGVVTYNIFITFDAPPANLLSGMSATVVIQTARHDNVLIIPTAALQTSNESQTVRVLKNGKLTSVDVTTDLSSDTDTEITSGLSVGDMVVTRVSSVTQTTAGSSPFGGGIRGGFGSGAIFRGGGGGGRGG